VKTIHLSNPIQRRSAMTGEVVDRVAELTLREPTAGDMVDALDEAGGDTRRIGSLTRALACRCAGISRADFDALSLDDGSRLMEAVAGFLPAGPKIGPTH
jgi:hypothetical protein